MCFVNLFLSVPQMQNSDKIRMFVRYKPVTFT